MTVVMMEGQGHGGFLGCGASREHILQHTTRLYRSLDAHCDGQHNTGGNRAGEHNGGEHNGSGHNGGGNMGGGAVFLKWAVAGSPLTQGVVAQEERVGDSARASVTTTLQRTATRLATHTTTHTATYTATTLRHPLQRVTITRLPTAGDEGVREIVLSGS